MKIKLKSNSLAVKQYLFELNLKCGYSYSSGDTPQDEFNLENSWAVKVFSKIEQNFPSLKAVPEQDKQIVNAITYSAKCLNEQYENSDYTENMEIVMNVNSKLNRFLRNGLAVIDIFYRPAKKLSTGVNDKAGHIHADSKKMVLGSSLFIKEHNNNDKKYNLTHYLVKKIGLERTVQFIVFHETSHAFEQVNKRKYKSVIDPRILEISQISHQLSLISNRGLVAEINQELKAKKLKKSSQIDQFFMREIRSLHQEIYADTSALFLIRNNDMINGTYNKEKTTELLDFIIDARKKEQHDEQETHSSDEYVSSFNHFTSPGLEYLKSKLDNMEERILTPLEIHTYCQEVVNVGVSRVLISSTHANINNAYQLNTIFHLNYDNDKFSLQSNLISSIYECKIKGLEQIAGKEWFDSFSKNLEIINSDKYINRTLAIWHAGVNKNAFQKDLNLAHSRNINNLKSFGVNSKTKEETISEISKSREKINSYNSQRNTLLK